MSTAGDFTHRRLGSKYIAAEEKEQGGSGEERSQEQAIDRGEVIGDTSKSDRPGLGMSDSSRTGSSGTDLGMTMPEITIPSMTEMELAGLQGAVMEMIKTIFEESIKKSQRMSDPNIPKSGGTEAKQQAFDSPRGKSDSYQRENFPQTEFSRSQESKRGRLSTPMPCVKEDDLGTSRFSELPLPKRRALDRKYSASEERDQDSGYCTDLPGKSAESQKAINTIKKAQTAAKGPEDEKKGFHEAKPPTISSSEYSSTSNGSMSPEPSTKKFTLALKGEPKGPMRRGTPFPKETRDDLPSYPPGPPPGPPPDSLSDSPQKLQFDSPTGQNAAAGSQKSFFDYCSPGPQNSFTTPPTSPPTMPPTKKTLKSPVQQQSVPVPFSPGKSRANEAQNSQEITTVSRPQNLGTQKKLQSPEPQSSQSTERNLRSRDCKVIQNIEKPDPQETQDPVIDSGKSDVSVSLCLFKPHLKFRINPNIVNEMIPDKRDYQCPVSSCKQIHHSQTDWIADFISHAKFSCTSKQFPCPQCGTVSRTRALFSKHAKFHLQPAYFCVCNQPFQEYEELRTHLFKHHDEIVMPKRDRSHQPNGTEVLVPNKFLQKVE